MFSSLAGEGIGPSDGRCRQRTRRLLIQHVECPPSRDSHGGWRCMVQGRVFGWPEAIAAVGRSRWPQLLAAAVGLLLSSLLKRQARVSRGPLLRVHCMPFHGANSLQSIHPGFSTDK
jgi:hypothetical protein